MAKNEEKAVVIGKASFIDIDQFLLWCDSDEADQFFSTENLWTGTLHKLQGEIPGVSVSQLHDAVRPRKMIYGDGVSRHDRENYYMKPLAKYSQYIQTFSSPENPLSFSLLYEHPTFDIIAFADSQFLIPAGNLNKTPFKDYSNIPVGAIHAQSSGMTANGLESQLVPAGSALSQTSLNSQKAFVSEKKQELEKLSQDMDDVKHARVGELATLQAEIDRQVQALEAKKEALMEVLLAKQSELQAAKAKLEQELFVLESEIYSIRCFLGEVVDFIQLKSGRPAASELPITLFQKVRFLDEEMGKAVALYDFDFYDSKLFEEFLKAREDAVELFCPNEKCVSLVRISKTGSAFRQKSTPYGEMLEQYEVYHGKKIGILIRNGENLYFGWTDDEKINIPDDLFFTPTSKIVNEEDAKNTSSTPAKEAASRYFIFSILQGVLENSNMLSLPEDVRVQFMKPSEYLVFSAADAWISDNRYGTLEDLIKKVNAKISVGDNVLSLTHLYDGQWSSNGWTKGFRFERDHNYSRRTHDVSFEDGEIYKINLIEKDEYYVSLVKQRSDYVYRNGGYYPRKREAHANFLVYESEIINLTYMNSVWLKYVITSRNLGRCGPQGKLESYAQTIRYLNKALAFVKEREKEEQALIEKYSPMLCEDPEWPVKLSEWKLANNVRFITDYQAKRFAKWRLSYES